MPASQAHASHCDDQAIATALGNAALGNEMHGWARDLFPICRSLTGPGVRETLRYLAQLLPGLACHSLPSGTPVFDWNIPDEWVIRDAYVLGPDGQRVIDFRVSNLHVVGYSEPVDVELDLEQLQPYLHSLPDQPEAIPYITSYYRRRWGFCLSQRAREQLLPGRYRAVIDSTLAPGVMDYADLLIPGESRDEVLLSTYICHPSMANNELSGPVVAAALARWLMSLPRRRLSYRVVFTPETIGAITYLSRNLDAMRQRTIAGYVLTCVGDERAVSFLPSRKGGTLADRAALHVLSHHAPGFKCYTFLDRGSDERQYCSPGIDLPVASVMRSKYREYPEYHTSLDDLTLVTPAGLAGTVALYQRIIQALEANTTWRTTCLCEPQMGRRGLYPTTSTKSTFAAVAQQMNLIVYSDGTRDLLDVAATLGADIADLAPLAQRLADAGVLVPVSATSRGA